MIEIIMGCMCVWMSTLSFQLTTKQHKIHKMANKFSFCWFFIWFFFWTFQLHKYECMAMKKDLRKFVCINLCIPCYVIASRVSSFRLLFRLCVCFNCHTALFISICARRAQKVKLFGNPRLHYTKTIFTFLSMSRKRMDVFWIYLNYVSSFYLYDHWEQIDISFMSITCNYFYRRH